MSKIMSKRLGWSIFFFLASLVAACSDEQKTAAKQESVAKQEVAIKVANWGPKGTKAGKAFLVQPNGDSVIWFEFSGPGNAHNLELWLGDQKLSGLAVNPGKGGSATVPPKLFSESKSVPVYLIYTPTGTKIELGTFDIQP